MLNTPVNSKIQELFKAFECFSSTFQGKFNFQGLFKSVLYIQVLFKPVQTLQYEFGILVNGYFSHVPYISFYQASKVKILMKIILCFCL